MRPRRRFTWPGWELLLVRWCIAFHAAAAAVLLLTPQRVLYTDGTAPVLALATPHTWAAVFTLAAALAWALLHYPQAAVQMCTWFVVFVPGGMWFTAFLLAALRGDISGLGALVWFCVYGPWVLAAVRIGLGKR